MKLKTNLKAGPLGEGDGDDGQDDSLFALTNTNSVFSL